MAIEANQLDGRLEFALEAAQEAGDLIMGFYQRSDLAVEQKGDETPVTAADRGAEELIRSRIGESFPEDGVLGEEFGEKASSNGFRWILDPVDGTKSFVHAVPLFGTLIGLEQNGRMVAGVCRFPALDEVVYASKGRGAWWQVKGGDSQRAHVTDTQRLDDALFCFTEIEGWHDVGRFDAFVRLGEAARMVRGWGDCYGHMLVATGRADLIVDPVMSPWDAGALVPILEEAGGHFVDWQGRAVIDGGNGISVNGPLKDRVVELLNQ